MERARCLMRRHLFHSISPRLLGNQGKWSEFHLVFFLPSFALRSRGPEERSDTAPHAKVEKRHRPGSGVSKSGLSMICMRGRLSSSGGLSGGRDQREKWCFTFQDLRGNLCCGHFKKIKSYFNISDFMKGSL